MTTELHTLIIELLGLAWLLVGMCFIDMRHRWSWVVLLFWPFIVLTHCCLCIWEVWNRDQE